jgi:hypothetical protein
MSFEVLASMIVWTMMEFFSSNLLLLSLRNILKMCGEVKMGQLSILVLMLQAKVVHHSPRSKNLIL